MIGWTVIVKEVLKINYITFIYSYDAVMHGNENEILDAFADYHAGVVFSAEVFIWPDQSLAVSFPTSVLVYFVL